MSNRWPIATKEHPCPVCGKTHGCKPAPDGTAAVCWHNGNGGKVIQLGKAMNGHNGNLNGSGTYTGKAHKPKSGGKIHANVETAIKAAAWSMPGAVHSATYNYPGEFKIIRFESAGRKDIRPIHLAEGGWKVADPAGKLPLYHSDALPADAEMIFVTEGEKCADLARMLGLVAVTSSHGAKSADRSDWTPLAESNATIVFLPDADADGERYVEDASAIIFELNPNAQIKVLKLPELPPGGDIEQFIEARDSMDTEAIAGSIIAMARAAAFVEAGEKIVEPWPDPKALPGGLPPVMPFDFNLLPQALHGWVSDISERMQCPADYCAATAMIVAGALIGRKVGIRPKRHDDWAVVPNLYGMNVGRPSLMNRPR